MKRFPVILASALLLFSLPGCRDTAAMAELRQLQAEAAVEDQNKQVMQTFFEAWSKGDYETLSDLTTPDYAFYVPSSSPNPLSREDLLSTNKKLRQAFPDISWRMENLVADGDTVVFRFVQTGTHGGAYEGIPPTGANVEGSGILMSRIRDGRVVEQWEDFDSLGFMMQLGMVLTPKE